MARVSIMVLLRQLARRSAFNPIEVIVLTFILVTLVYFQLLQAVKESDFLNSPVPGSAHEPVVDSPSFDAVVQQVAPSKWASVGAGIEPDVCLQQVVISLDGAPAGPHRRNDLVYDLSSGSAAADEVAEEAATASRLGLRDPRLVAQLQLLEKGLRQDLTTETGRMRWDPDLCYRSKASAPCFASGIAHGDSAVGSALFPDDRTYVLTLGFEPEKQRPQRDWAKQVRNSSRINEIMAPTMPKTAHAASFRNASTSELRFSFASSQSDLDRLTSHNTLKEMRDVRWFAYAIRAFVMRFYALARNADSADIFVMLIAYLLMHLTFVKLFLNMRQLGSKVWLATSVLVSGTISFLCALLTAHVLGLTVNPVLLSEALPILVCIVGFEKPFVLARAVFTNPSLAPSASASHSPVRNMRSNRDYFSAPNPSGKRRTATGAPSDASHPPPARVGVRWSNPAPAQEVVTRAVERQGGAIVRDYAIEIAVLCAGGLSGIPGLTDFCRLAALILAYDCLFLFAFYVSILTVMVEIHRIRIMRGLKRQDSSADLARILDDGTTSFPTQEPLTNLSLREQVVKLATGVAPGEKATPESPTARLKLLLLISFLVLHAFNFLSTLTASTAFLRHHGGAHRVDPQSPTISPVLAQLAAYQPTKPGMVASISPPLHIRVFLPHVTGSTPASLPGAVPLALLDRFMTAWTRIAGDPVLSKWIVVALGVSVILNGYLLKGLAVNSSAGGEGEGFAPMTAAEAAARILIASTRAAVGHKASATETTDQAKRAKLPRRWSGGAEGIHRFKTEWTLADAAEMAAERRKQMIEEEAADEVARTARRERRVSDSSDGSESQPPSPLLVRPRARRLTSDGKPIHEPRPSGHLALPGQRRDNGVPIEPPLLSVPRESRTEDDNSASSSSTADDLSTPATTVNGEDERAAVVPTAPRTLEQLVKMFDTGANVHTISDEEIILLVQKGKVAAYSLEKLLKNNERAVRIRRALISRASVTKTLEASGLPYLHYDYEKVMGQCCENVVGYLPLPLGIAGPLRIDGKALPIPMATTEGALVASTSRGCKALNAGGGVTTVLTQDAMTRGPALEFPSIISCAAAKAWIDSDVGSTAMKAAFNSTSRFARLVSLKTAMAGRTLFVRFATQTGDAMGMNMISKGTERAVEMMMTDYFPEMRVVSLSGNYCIDKKPAAINWIEGRGKSVVAEGVVPGEVVKSVLKTTVADLVKLNITKNLVGSSMAGSIGGNNAHASNTLTAIFLATGQDPAQNVESSSCMTLMEPVNGGRDLLITCSMPSIEVGTIGGGTILAPQGAMLDMLGVRGPHSTSPGDNARNLARIVCAAVLAGELSLMSALAAGHLVKSHLALNRSQPVTPATLDATGRTFLTPAPTRPGTPGPPRQGNGLAGLSLTPVAPSTPKPQP